MPNISGNVLFSSNRIISSISNLVPIKSVSVTLYNPLTKVGATVLTNANGEFEFTNVLKGEYLLVETASVSNANQSPFDFSTATIVNQPIPKDPSIDSVSIPNIPKEANIIDSLTPNTILITVNLSDLLNQHFIDGPVKYTPINILNSISSGNNLITLAHNGDFGINPLSTPINTSPSSNPYPTLATGFEYQKYSKSTPIDGNISIVNIESLSNFGVWWNLTDHTTGSESGNFLVVNGDNPSASIFEQDIELKPNTYYVFSAWIANQVKTLGYVDPKFILVISGKTPTTTDIIYSQESNIIPINTNVAEWVQIGTIFNSKSYSTINVNFLSDGAAATGNDYAIDDVSLKEIIINTNVIEVSKFVKNNFGLSGESAKIGDTLTYTISIANISTTSTLVDVVVTDTLSKSLTLVPNSIKGGILLENKANTLKLSTDTIPILSSRQISFDAVVNSNTTTTPNILNRAQINYGISISPNLGPAPGVTITNTTYTKIEMANLQISKTVFPSVATVPQVVSYNIDIFNNGDVTANNIFLIDTLPKSIIFNPNTLIVNNLTLPTTTLVNGSISITLPNMAPLSTTNIKFNATVNTTIPGVVVNTVDVFYNFISSGVVSTTITSSASVPLIINLHPTTPHMDVKLCKDSSMSCLRFNQATTYTVTITNNSDVSLTNVVFYDTLPDYVSYIENSLLVDGIEYGVENLNTGVNIGSIIPNSSVVVSFKVMLLCNNYELIINKSCISYNSNFNPSTSFSSCSNINTVYIIESCCTHHKCNCKCKHNCTCICCCKNHNIHL